MFESATASVVLSGATLFFIGWYEARTTVGSLWRRGVQMAIIGLGAGVAGFLIGHFIGAPPEVPSTAARRSKVRYSM